MGVALGTQDDRVQRDNFGSITGHVKGDTRSLD